MFDNHEFVKAYLVPHLGYLERQWSQIGKEINVRFDNLTLGKLKNGKKLKPFELDRLAAFTGYASLDEPKFSVQPWNFNETDFAEAEASLNIQLRLLQNRSIKARRLVKHHLHFPNSVSLYAYVEPGKAWLCNVEESFFIENRYGLTNTILKHIKRSTKSMPNISCPTTGDDRKFALRFSIK